MSIVIKVTQELQEDIVNGRIGKSGDYFLSIRELAKEKNISYVSAQKVTTALRTKGLIILCGNHQYITYGPIAKNSPLYDCIIRYRGEKKRIGMYINRLSNEFFTSITEYLSNELLDNGYELVILTGNGSFEREKNALESFVMLGVEAVISCPGFGEDISEVYKNYILPTVFVGRYPHNLVDCTAVLVNNVNAGRQVATHFSECGCNSYIYVGSSQLKGEKDMRLEGFKKQLAIDGAEFNNENVIHFDLENTSEGRSEFKNVYTKCKKPVGVFCYHDMLAVKIMGICNRYNIDIPKDVLLAGVDNLPVCEVVSPRLTSVSYRFDTMAHAVIEGLFALMKNPNKPLGHHYINQSLTIRKSTNVINE